MEQTLIHILKLLLMALISLLGLFIYLFQSFWDCKCSLEQVAYDIIQLEVLKMDADQFVWLSSPGKGKSWKIWERE